MSSAAVCKSVPQLNSISTFDSDSFDFDFMFFTLFTEDIALSIILVTFFSTSSGAEFSYTVFTLIIGISIFGK